MSHYKVRIFIYEQLEQTLHTHSTLFKKVITGLKFTYQAGHDYRNCPNILYYCLLNKNIILYR